MMEFENLQTMYNSLEEHQIIVLKMANGEDIPFDTNDELFIKGNDVLFQSEEHSMRIVNLDHICSAHILDFKKMSEDMSELKKAMLSKLFEED